jgi:sigma-B regulation protein RsbU (phosphoserine phosphatase)
VIELAATGTFVGLVPGAAFPTARLPLERGDRIVVFTDGATEQWSPSGDAFDEQRLADVVRDANQRSGRASETRVGQRIEAALEAFVGRGRPLADDVTVVVVTWLEDR